MRTLLLIDANSIIHRCFHALPPLNAPDGRPVQALYGISSMLLRLLNGDNPSSAKATEGRPDYAVACFDRPEPTFRKIAYAPYKAQRPKAPDELISQIIEAHQVFEKFGIKTIEKAGFEADDIIATLAMTFGSEPDIKTVILTGDLDTLQIVNDEHIIVRTFRKGLSDTVTYDEAAVRERYGLEPRQLVDYKTLVGDKSDNVPGVPGVGEKTATAILQKYGTLEKFLKNLSKEPKYQEKFSKAAQHIESSKFLVTVKKDVPLAISSFEELSFSLANKEDLKKYFSSLGFESLIRRLEDGGKPREKITIPKRPTNASLFGTSLPAAETEKQEIPHLGAEEKTRVFFIQEGKEYSANDLQSEKLKIGFDLKEVSKRLITRDDEPLAPPLYDLGVAFWLLDPDFKEYRPDALARIFLGKEWRGDAENYEQLYAFSRARIREYKMTKLFETIEMPLVNILAQMETWGISVSRSTLQDLEKKIAKKLHALTQDIQRLAGVEFNINSPKQLGEVLYEKLGLASKKGVKISTRADRLETLRDAHPIIAPILQYREDFKIQSTYVKPLQALPDKKGLLRTEFMQVGTGTGRISSRNPNMQNIPQESGWAKALRQAFVARPGCSFLSFDYSQLELRILAGISGDKNMTAAFREGQDIHQITAAKVFGIAPSQVAPHQRRIAKALNFGLIYGMGSSAFAASSGVSRREAEEFSRAYFVHFSGVARFIEETKQEVHRKGYVETLTGRRRYFPNINAGNPRITAENERQAVNHPVQGLEADFIKLAMIRSEAILKEKKVWGSKVRMLLTIHDELLFEVEDDMIQEIIPLIRTAMQEVWPEFPIRLTVTVSCGATWGDMERTA